MGRLILQMQTSIDCFVADADGGTGWMVWAWNSSNWSWDTKLQAYHEQLTASGNTILLSSRMAREGFIDHWTQISKDPDNPQSGFARNVSEARKIIFSHSPNALDASWSRSSVAERPLAEEVAELKTSSQSNILAFGGVEFARSLVKENLVDEYHFIVNPYILHRGLSIFTQATQLQLIGATAYSSGITVTRYSKAAADAKTDR